MCEALRRGNTVSGKMVKVKYVAIESKLRESKDEPSKVLIAGRSGHSFWFLTANIRKHNAKTKTFYVPEIDAKENGFINYEDV